jgi:hypothetical protein
LNALFSDVETDSSSENFDSTAIMNLFSDERLLKRVKVKYLWSVGHLIIETCYEFDYDALIDFFNRPQLKDYIVVSTVDTVVRSD